MYNVSVIDSVCDLCEWKLMPDVVIEKWESDMFEMFGMKWCVK